MCGARSEHMPLVAVAQITDGGVPLAIRAMCAVSTSTGIEPLPSKQLQLLVRWHIFKPGSALSSSWLRGRSMMMGRCIARQLNRASPLR